MTVSKAALTRCVPRASSRQHGLSFRSDLAVPAAVLTVQLTGAAATAGSDILHPVHPGAVAWALLVVGPLALVERRRHPVAVLWVTFASTLAPSGSDLAYLSLIIALFGAVTRGHHRWAWLVAALRYVWTMWLAPLASGHAGPPERDVLLLGGWLLVLLIAAEATRIRAERAVATKDARQIDQRRRESEERVRVARDLHDVIGHNISLISVQASVGLDLMDSQPEQARAALGAIKAASKEALDELRTMLAALRRDEDVAPLSPTPDLDRLPDLIELTRAAGLNVEVQVVGKPSRLPTSIQLAAYRIIQESLTNIARHAGRARVTVELTYDDAELLVDVADDGKAPSNGASSIGPGSGIAGMRERATALGGVLEAGFRPGGGFKVSARLPVQSPA